MPGTVFGRQVVSPIPGRRSKEPAHLDIVQADARQPKPGNDRYVKKPWI